MEDNESQNSDASKDLTNLTEFPGAEEPSKIEGLEAPTDNAAGFELTNESAETAPQEGKSMLLDRPSATEESVLLENTANEEESDSPPTSPEGLISDLSEVIESHEDANPENIESAAVEEKSETQTMEPLGVQASPSETPQDADAGSEISFVEESPTASPKESDPPFEIPPEKIPEKSKEFGSAPDVAGYEVVVKTESDEVMDEIREYAEKVPIGKPPVQAGYPFTLSIDGVLTPSEQEKLLEVLSSENMGIRQIDLEPQLEAGKILLPRISEFAGILIVQTLKDSRTRMRLAPSEEYEGAFSHTEAADSDVFLEENLPPAEQIPLVAGTEVPGLSEIEIIDAVTASATLKSTIVEAKNSQEYRETLEALQRKLKYQAHAKGAEAVINFKINLTPLAPATHYRLIAMGTAVASKNRASFVEGFKFSDPI